MQDSSDFEIFFLLLNKFFERGFFRLAVPLLNLPARQLQIIESHRKRLCQINGVFVGYNDLHLIAVRNDAFDCVNLVGLI